jgi:hypothetical protein
MTPPEKLLPFSPRFFRRATQPIPPRPRRKLVQMYENLPANLFFFPSCLRAFVVNLVFPNLLPPYHVEISRSYWHNTQFPLEALVYLGKIADLPGRGLWNDCREEWSS